MNTTEKLLEALESEAAESGPIMYEIDPDTRLINIPKDFLLGVESDEKSHRVYFTCPKIVGANVDLTKYYIRVNWENANGKIDYDEIDDVVESETTPGNVVFSWLLSREVTEKFGNVTFTVCAARRIGGEVSNEWNTIPAVGKVEQGLEPVNKYLTELSFAKGTTFSATLFIKDGWENDYAPKEGDTITFSVKKTLEDPTVIEKDIPIDTMRLEIPSSETESLEVGEYIFNVSLTNKLGETYSVIPMSTLTLLKEVT